VHGTFGRQCVDVHSPTNARLLWSTQGYHPEQYMPIDRFFRFCKAHPCVRQVRRPGNVRCLHQQATSMRCKRSDLITWCRFLLDSNDLANVDPLIERRASVFCRDTAWLLVPCGCLGVPFSDASKDMGTRPRPRT